MTDAEQNILIQKVKNFEQASKTIAKAEGKE